MKASLLVILLLLFSLGGSYLFTTLLSTGPEAASGDAGSQAELERLARELASLRDENRELRMTVDSLRSGALGPAGATRTSLETPGEAVERWIRENRPDLLPVEAGEGPAASGAPVASASDEATAMLARLNAPGLTEADREQIWQEIRDAGLMDEVLGILEAAVAANPSDPAAHLALAGGYLNKIFEESGPAAGQWAVKADQSLDTALELDPNNWEARFTKAVALSFWPPVMGKQGEAIHQFELLIETQKSLPADPSHSQAYLFLGNMHQQMGNHEKALATWQQGLLLFPDSAELMGQVEHAVTD